MQLMLALSVDRFINYFARRRRAIDDLLFLLFRA